MVEQDSRAERVLHWLGVAFASVVLLAIAFVMLMGVLWALVVAL